MPVAADRDEMGAGLNKYHSRRHAQYASRREANLAANLRALEKAGKIADLQEQVKFELLPKQSGKLRNERPVSYLADFVYSDETGRHVLDAKGFRTREYVIKRKLMKFMHGIEIEEV